MKPSRKDIWFELKTANRKLDLLLQNVQLDFSVEDAGVKAMTDEISAAQSQIPHSDLPAAVQPSTKG